MACVGQATWQASQLYYGALLERLKVKAHVFRVGTYKDFVEPYLRNDQSAPAKEARKARARKLAASGAATSAARPIGPDAADC